MRANKFATTVAHGHAFVGRTCSPDDEALAAKGGSCYSERSRFVELVLMRHKSQPRLKSSFADYVTHLTAGE
jgi:hypothetical protein